MSAMSASVLVALVSAVLILALAGLWASIRLRQREEYRRYRAQFFSLAREVIQAEDCPIEMAIGLRALGGSMNNLVVLVILVYSAVTRMAIPWIKPPSSFIAAFDQAPRGVRTSFGKAYRSAICAVSYRSILFGPLIRRHYCDNDKLKKVDQAVIYYGERRETPDFLEQTAEGGLRLKVANC